MLPTNTSLAVAPSSAVAWVRSAAWWLGLLMVITCSLLMRLLWLEADAATTLTWSGAPFTDEGLYSHAARNRALFGAWRTNEWDNRLVSPLFDGLAFGVFWLFGVGFAQVRLISIGFSMGALLLFWDLLRRDWGRDWAILGSALWGLDYFWFQFSRLGLLEPSMVAWLVAAAWCWRRSLDRGVRWAILCGVCAAIAFVWKSLALLWLPVPLLALLLLNNAWSRWQLAAGYLAGVGSILALYGLFWYVPHQQELTAYNQFYAADRLPASLGELVAVPLRHLRSSYVWGQTPILVAAALLGGLKALLAIRRAVQPVVALTLAWTICGAALLIMPYSPPRYYTLVLPAIVCLALAAIVPAAQVAAYRYAPYAAAGLLGASLLWNGWWYARWASDRRTTLRDSAREVQRLVPRGELVLGVAACGLSLGNDLPCAPPFAGLANDDRPVETLGARYALVEDAYRDDYLRRFYGPLLGRSTRLAQIPLGSRRLTLYRFDEQALPGQEP